MAKITIYGASDDLIEIEGDVTEEFNFYPHNDGEDGKVFVSDGTVLGVEYDDDGIWRFKLLIKGSAEMTKTEGSVDEEDGNSDRVTLEGENLAWVGLGTHLAR